MDRYRSDQSKGTVPQIIVDTNMLHVHAYVYSACALVYSKVGVVQINNLWST